MEFVKKQVDIGGVTLHLSDPDMTGQSWVGQDEIFARSSLAGWLSIRGIVRSAPAADRSAGHWQDDACHRRGPASQATAFYQSVHGGHASRGPDHYPCTGREWKIAYHASPLVTAMIVGGVCVLDEGNRMNEKSWASRAPLLDHRRYVESIVAGITIPCARGIPRLRDDERR